jgi:hypothetical protein
MTLDDNTTIDVLAAAIVRRLSIDANEGLVGFAESFYVLMVCDKMMDLGEAIEQRKKAKQCQWN